MFADTKNFIVRRVDPIRWELMKPLVYEGRTQTFVVPEGYVTDLLHLGRSGQLSGRGRHVSPRVA
jgi:hypothetical protein